MIYEQGKQQDDAVNEELIEFKRVMEHAIFLSRKDKKVIAIEFDVPASALSHWISSRTVFSMPGHMINLFCTVVGNDLLRRHVNGEDVA